MGFIFHKEGSAKRGVANFANSFKMAVNGNTYIMKITNPPMARSLHS